jgi:hypothetical protein
MIKLLLTLLLLLNLLITPVSAEENKKTEPPLPECVKTDCDCKDFNTQQEAQRVLDAFAGDPHKLDRDKDGIACEKPKK